MSFMQATTSASRVREGLPLLGEVLHTAPAEDVTALVGALDATGGSCSVLFQHNPRNGSLQATSGVGLDALPSDPWNPAGPGSGGGPGNTSGLWSRPRVRGARR